MTWNHSNCSPKALLKPKVYKNMWFRPHNLFLCFLPIRANIKRHVYCLSFYVMPRSPHYHSLKKQWWFESIATAAQKLSYNLKTIQTCGSVPQNNPEILGSPLSTYTRLTSTMTRSVSNSEDFSRRCSYRRIRIRRNQWINKFVILAACEGFRTSRM